jgi:ACS family tartrate transporter-like MFS transporter
MPFLFLLYITAYIDRVNVGFAGLDMTHDLHFSNEVFGFGAGIFFFGYCLLEVPGAMLAQSWSARRWIAIIMVGWGSLATLTGFIQNAAQFNIIRFLLGLAEGGFFPAVIVYLTHWYRQEDRSKAIAMFMAAIPVSTAVGAPIAGLLLRLHWLNVPGWRWLLILEGLPAAACGLVTLAYLPDWPRDARWLPSGERRWITRELTKEATGKGRRHGRLIDAFRRPLVLGLAVPYFLVNMSAYGLTIWLPKLLREFKDITNLELSLLAAIPSLCAIPAMLIAGWHCDRTGGRKWHAVFSALTCAAGLAVSMSSPGNRWIVVTGYSLASMGAMAFYPTFWALPTRMMHPAIAAASFGFINLIANLGGFLGPYLVGYFTDRTGTYVAGVLVLVATATLGAAYVLLLPDRRRSVEAAAATAFASQFPQEADTG